MILIILILLNVNIGIWLSNFLENLSIFGLKVIVLRIRCLPTIVLQILQALVETIVLSRRVVSLLSVDKVVETLLILVVWHFQHQFFIHSLLTPRWSTLRLSINDEKLFQLLIVFKQVTLLTLKLALVLAVVAANAHIDCHIHILGVLVGELGLELTLLCPCLRLWWRLKHWDCHGREQCILSQLHVECWYESLLLSRMHILQIHLQVSIRGGRW